MFELFIPIVYPFAKHYQGKLSVVTQNYQDIRIAFASNNKRRLTYGRTVRRGCLNRQRVLDRRKMKANKRQRRKPYKFNAIDEMYIIGLDTSNCNDTIFQTSNSKQHFSAVPYDFDTKKNALIVLKR